MEISGENLHWRLKRGELNDRTLSFNTRSQKLELLPVKLKITTGKHCLSAKSRSLHFTLE